MVLEGWKVVRLNELAAKQQSSFTNGPFGSNLLTSELRSSGVPVIYIRDIKDGFYKPKGTVYVDECKADELSACEVLPGDLLITKVGDPPAIASIYPDGLRRAIITQDVIRLRVDRDKSVPSFVRSLINSPLGHSLIEDIVIEGTRRRVSLGSFKQIKFLLPSLVEQKRISEILDSVDDAIAATQAVIDQTRKVKQGLLQQLLTRGIEHTKFKETEIGLIPESWNVKRLVDIVASDRPITYGIVQAGPHTPNGVPYIRVSDMVSSSLSPEGMLRTSFAIAEKYKRSAVYSGDIVYALRGKIGHVLSVPKSLDGANLTQGTARISPGSEVEPNYLLWSLRSQVATDQAELVSKGSTFKEISLAALKEIRIPVPTKQEQFKIASFMGEIEKYICDCTESLRVLGITKNGLMQDLLTGRVRVNG